MFKDKNLIQTLISFGEQGILLLISLATIGAVLIEVARIIDSMTVNLSDLFLLFIYAEVLGMVAIFYKDHRIPVTLPIIIAITALTRMIVLQTKELEPINIVFEASGILLLAIAAYVMSAKERMSLDKLKAKKEMGKMANKSGQGKKGFEGGKGKGGAKDERQKQSLLDQLEADLNIPDELKEIIDDDESNFKLKFTTPQDLIEKFSDLEE